MDYEEVAADCIHAVPLAEKVLVIRSELNEVHPCTSGSNLCSYQVHLKATFIRKRKVRASLPLLNC